MKCCENHIFVWKLSHFMFFFMLFTLVVDQGQHSWIIIQQFTIKVPVKTAKQSMSAALV